MARTPQVLDRVVASVRRRGVVASAARIGAEVGFAARHGVGHRRRAGDPRRHEPVRVATVRWVLDRVGPVGRSGAFLDVGCGRGRVLCLAAEAGFTRVVGVEVDPTLAGAASAAVGGLAEVVQADAAVWPVPTDVTVVFLFNPFDAPVLERFLDRLRESIDAAPRSVTLAYANPVDHAVVADHGWVVVEAGPDVTLYRLAGG